MRSFALYYKHQFVIGITPEAHVPILCPIPILRFETEEKAWQYRHMINVNSLDLKVEELELIGHPDNQFGGAWTRVNK